MRLRKGFGHTWLAAAGLACLLIAVAAHQARTQNKTIRIIVPYTPGSGPDILSRLMGAETQLVDEGFDIGIRESWAQALDSVKAQGGTPYAVPAGASDHPLGGPGLRAVGTGGTSPGA